MKGNIFPHTGIRERAHEISVLEKIPGISDIANRPPRILNTVTGGGKSTVIDYYIVNRPAAVVTVESEYIAFACGRSGVVAVNSDIVDYNVMCSTKDIEIAAST
jgi:hypothetical protein